MPAPGGWNGWALRKPEMDAGHQSPAPVQPYRPGLDDRAARRGAGGAVVHRVRPDAAASGAGRRAAGGDRPVRRAVARLGVDAADRVRRRRNGGSPTIRPAAAADTDTAAWPAGHRL